MQSVFIFKLHFSYLLNRWLRGALCAYVMEGGGGGGGGRQHFPCDSNF